MQGMYYDMPVASAQVKSAVLLAGLYSEGETTVHEPYTSRDHTEQMLRAFGVDVKCDGCEVTVHKTDEFISPECIEVPGDISSAAFWLVAASIIPDSELTLKNVGINPTRTGIIDVLLAMGADIKIINERTSGGEAVGDIVVKYAKLHGTSFGKEIMPRLIDEIPVIAVAAMFAKERTVITGAGELRVKETDRLAAITEQFNKFSDCIIGTEDGLIIENNKPLAMAECFSYDDHRIAMALAVAGAAGSGVAIENADCVNISYPSFYETLAKLTK
jgi:3-phosphoshikimate 1-carboxyvinyltransferase